MNKLILLSLLLISGSCFAQNTTVKVTLPLTAVTVYLNGAELQHSGEVSLPAGTSEIRLTGISPYLLSQSLQVQPGNGAELLSANPVPAYSLQSTGKLPADSLQQLQREINVLNAENAALEQERGFLNSNRQVSSGIQANWTSELQKAASFLNSRTKELYLRQLEVTNRLAIANQRLAVYQQQPGAQNTIRPTFQDVLIRLQVPKAGPVRLELRYLSSGSQWEPRLDLRVPEIAREMRLQAQSKAAVFNGSGLDWSNVKLELRTANPQAGASRPNMQPWTLQYSGGSFEEGRLDNYAVKGNSRGRASDSAAVEVADLSARFELPGRVTIKSGVQYLASLGEQQLPMRLEYLAIPKLDQDTFLVAKITEWEKLNMVGDKATVFFRGAYIGETELSTRSYNDTLEVSLGRDNQVIVSRTKREDFNSKNLAGTTQRSKVAYEINVKNTHRAPIRIRVLDQIPVSQEKSIEVKDVETGGAQLEAASGKLTWLLTIASGESKKLPFGFTIEYPKNKRVNLHRNRKVHTPKFR